MGTERQEGQVVSTSSSPSAACFKLDEELVEKVRACFRESKSATQVVGAFRAHTITHKQFSSKVLLKAKVLCVSLKPENNGFKCRISTIKFSTNEPPQIRESWKVKQVTSLRTLSKARTDFKPQVTISFTGSGTETFVFDSASERSAFLGCVLVYNQKASKKRIDCVDFDPATVVAVWRQAKSESSAIVNGEESHAFQDALVDTKKEEEIKDVCDLEAFIEESKFSLSNLKGLEGFLQAQLFDLDSSNIHAILSNVQEVDGVVGRVNDTLEYVDDLEEWLSVFNTKLTHMRIDISTIEERNNALETKSENNSALLKELQGLQQGLVLDDVTLQNIIITNFNESNLDLAVNAARKLHNLLCSFDDVPADGEEDEEVEALPSEFLSMRAVKEKKSELKRLKNTWMSSAKAFLISLFAKSVNGALGNLSGAMSDPQSFSSRAVKQIVNRAIQELHNTCKSYIGLIDVLIMFDSSAAESLAQHYARNVNRLIDRYVKLICERPIQVLQRLASAEGVAEEGESGSRSSISNIANMNFGAKQKTRQSKITSLEKPNEEIPELFAHILDQIMPKICKDCTFCGICFFSKDRDDVGRWLEEELDADWDIEWSDKDAIKSTIKVLLKDISGVIFDFINQALKLDHAFSIPFMKLITSWIYRMQGREEYFQTVQWLQEIQAITVSTFNTYMENHMSTIQNPNVFKLLQGKSVKGIWILQYFLKFPRIVEHVERLSQQAEEVANFPQTSSAEPTIYKLSAELIEASYCKYSEKSFHALEDLLSMEMKSCHADRLRIENYEFYCSSIASFQTSLPRLSKFFEIASKRKEAAKQRYIMDLLEWSAFASVFKFLFRLEKLRKDIPPSDISFQYGFTPQDVLKAISSIPKDADSVKNQAVAIRNRIQKHFKNDQILFKQVLREVFREIKTSFESMASNLKECYPMLGSSLPSDMILGVLKGVTS
ncbi:subunit Sec3 of exocyst complex [Chloropicon primus]|uniref:Subunit Sec3 of exocyst complex n=1 Tax=Chloropicon primus TaxID=1764295 RepID=A0A5B8ME95_9CHLO|nr:subunit Sec3 of exocyst complex [Chloropicon primus]UPQ96886.1 subunit Sec3 of exocyst complex [Chloropicon primus]|eukprot:QDZ17670.1 subunit Sec3 of exocyst complex [Chloropicon primus]